MSTDTKPEKPKYQSNPKLPNIFIDSLQVHHRVDKIYFVGFGTSSPDGVYEQFRMITTDEHLKGIINTLCESSKYYPKKPRNVVKKVPRAKKR